METVAATETSINAAAQFLRDGRLVAFPTETVYGLGGDAENDAAIARIFEAKGRPRFNPLIVHVANLQQAEDLAVFDDRSRDIAQEFWPGALTLILHRKADAKIGQLVTAGLDTLAVRCPNAAIAQALIQATNKPIAAPSANLSGHLSPTQASHVDGNLGPSLAMILDGGACEVGVESTIIDLSDGPPTLLRSGGVTIDRLEKRLGPISLPSSSDIKAPGMMFRHYAPNTPLRLNAHTLKPGEAGLAFGPTFSDQVGKILNLSPAGDLIEAAANLFAFLHQLDAYGVDGIAVAPIPQNGLGAAINDRLRRGSSAA